MKSTNQFLSNSLSLETHQVGLQDQKEIQLRKRHNKGQVEALRKRMMEILNLIDFEVGEVDLSHLSDSIQIGAFILEIIQERYREILAQKQEAGRLIKHLSSINKASALEVSQLQKSLAQLQVIAEAREGLPSVYSPEKPIQRVQCNGCSNQKRVEELEQEVKSWRTRYEVMEKYKDQRIAILSNSSRSFYRFEINLEGE